MNKVTHPDIEERFLEPEGWRWHVFKNEQGRDIRFGTVPPESGIPDAVVIVLQGLGEFTEKYFELARNLVSRNLSFWMIDWQGQGKSYRHLKDSHKRHSDGFDQDIADLHYFLMEYVKHSAVHPDVGRIPLVMLGHSMGANIGLRYLKEHPDMFACAAFSAPMIKIKALKNIPTGLSLALTGICKEFLDQSYLEFGGKGWHPNMRDHAKHDIHSSDPVRKQVHNQWCIADPALQVGNITYGWLHEANKSCAKVSKKGFVDDIETPCLFGLPGKEKLVSNGAARSLAKAMPEAKILELPESKHEILMERDDIRDEFLNTFLQMLVDHNIKEKLKTF